MIKKSVMIKYLMHAIIILPNEIRMFVNLSSSKIPSLYIRRFFTIGKYTVTFSLLKISKMRYFSQSSVS